MAIAPLLRTLAAKHGACVIELHSCGSWCMCARCRPRQTDAVACGPQAHRLFLSQLQPSVREAFSRTVFVELTYSKTVPKQFFWTFLRSSGMARSSWRDRAMVRNRVFILLYLGYPTSFKFNRQSLRYFSIRIGEFCAFTKSIDSCMSCKSPISLPS